MTLDQAISTTEMQAKLKNLREHMPNADDFMCRVGEYFAERLGGHEQVNPMGFVNAFNLMIYDLRTGVNGFTGKPVPHSLTGQPPQLYAVLSMYVPIFAEKVCPESFAQDVRQFCDEVSSEMKKKQ